MNINKNYVIGILAITTLLSITHSCQKVDEPQPMSLQAPAQLSMANPCDSFYYEPVDWGAELKVVKNTITLRDRKPYGKSCQAKLYAYSKLLPTNYLQDSLKERTMVCDVDTIQYTDKFYICWKRKLK